MRRALLAGIGKGSALAGWGALPVLPLLAGCSPTYDWREVRAEDGASLVLMPGKPAKLTRAIDLDGMKVDMAMQGAQAAETAFTMASVTLPEASDEMRLKALQAMRVGMVRNIAGTERAVRELTVPVVDAGGRTVGSVPAIEVEATGRMNDREAVLMARFVAVGPKAWQCVVLGSRIEREPAQTFLGSFRLVQA
jgi:hypothetical protein